MRRPHAFGVMRGKLARRVVRNPEDGSYTLLEKKDGRWTACGFGASQDDAEEFLRHNGIIKPIAC